MESTKLEMFGPRLRETARMSPELLAFGIFTVTICLIDMTLTFVGPRSLAAKLIPFTGWGAGMPYLFCLFWVFYLVFGKQCKQSSRWGMVGPLLVYMLFGVVKFVLPKAPNYDNPYLTVSPWQPLWTVVIPAIWIALLLGLPKIRASGVKAISAPST